MGGRPMTLNFKLLS